MFVVGEGDNRMVSIYMGELKKNVKKTHSNINDAFVSKFHWRFQTGIIRPHKKS